jgi:uncharacterized protein YjhX (UPF0386 family)
VLDLDLAGDPSFAQYVEKQKLDSDASRFLTVAAWFKECRQDNEITVDHVYTCYRAVGWPTNIDDFSSPLRSLKHQQLMTSNEKGLYSINHLGLSRVEKLRDA